MGIIVKAKPVARVHPDPTPEVPERARQRTFSAAYKQRILGEYEGLSKADKGALLRREGLYSSLITQWRSQRDQGALRGLNPKRVGPGSIRDNVSWFDSERRTSA